MSRLEPFHSQEKWERIGVKDIEDIRSEGESMATTEASNGAQASSARDPEEWTVDEVANWLWNLEGDKHRRHAKHMCIEMDVNGDTFF